MKAHFSHILYPYCLVTMVAFFAGTDAFAQPADTVLLKEGVGLKDIEVGRAAAADVFKAYGAKHRLIRHDGSHELYFTGRCLSFYYRGGEPKKSIYQITLQWPCKAATIRGITLGRSTLADAVEIYGEAEPLKASVPIRTWYYEYSGIRLHVPFEYLEEDDKQILRKRIVAIDITDPKDFAGRVP